MMEWTVQFKVIPLLIALYAIAAIGFILTGLRHFRAVLADKEDPRVKIVAAQGTLPYVVFISLCILFAGACVWPVSYAFIYYWGWRETPPDA